MNERPLMGQLPQQPLSYRVPTPALPVVPPRRTRKLFAWILFIGLCVMLFMLLSKQGGTFKMLPLGEFVEKLENKQIVSVAIEVDELIVKTSDGGNYKTALPPGLASNWDFVRWLLDKSQGNASVEVRNANNLVVNILLPLVPWLLIFLFIWFFVFRQLRQTAKAQPSQAAPFLGPGRWVPDEPGKTGQS